MKFLLLFALFLFLTTKVVCFKLLITSDFNKFITYKVIATICLQIAKWLDVLLDIQSWQSHFPDITFLFSKSITIELL